MKPEKLTAGFCALSLLTAIAACAPGTPGQLAGQPAATVQIRPGATGSAQPVKTHHVNFEISFPKNFQLADQNVSASYARLRVQGLVDGQVVTKFPTNPDADANGYVPISNGAVRVGGEIPEGNNWVLIADLQINTNPNSNPLNRVMGTFHVTSAGSPTVQVNAGTYLPAMIVSALQEMNSSLLSSALDLSALKDFCDGLTGTSGSGDSITFSRLNTDVLSQPSQLSGRALALALANGTAMTNAAGEGLDPTNYRQTPYLASNYSMVSGDALFRSLAHFGIPALSPDTGNFYFMDVIYSTQAGTVTSNNFYSVDAGLNQQSKVQKSEVYYGATSLGHNTGNTPVLYTNSSGSTQLLRAYKQSDASQVWSFTFGGGTGRNAFLPVSQIDTKGTSGDTSDDQDVVYTYYPAASDQDRGIYAVQGGVGRWFYHTSNITNGAALSPDGNTLYVVTFDTHDSGAAASLIALPTRTGGTFIDKVTGVGCGCPTLLYSNQNAPTWTVNLAGGDTEATSPAIGSDGTIYVGTFNGTSAGYLRAYNPNGSPKWAQPVTLPPGPLFNAQPLPDSLSLLQLYGHRPGPAFSPIIDNQNGHDVIYVLTDYAQVFALNDDGTPKWKDSEGHIQSVQLGSTAEQPTGNPFGVHISGAPVLGVEPLSQSRILYTGTVNDMGSNPEVAAIRDDGSKGTVVWSKHLGGTAVSTTTTDFQNKSYSKGGFQLKDGYLYFLSVNGGEGTIANFQKVKVEADNMPPGAPWPMYGGNPALSGRRPSDVNL